MAEYGAHIEPQSEYHKEVAAHMSDLQNLRSVRFIDFRQDANLSRTPDYYVYVFNIAPVPHQVRRPPTFPLVTFAACPRGEKYALVGRIPNIVNEKWLDEGGSPRVTGIDGRRFATDLLNPSNLGIDIWGEVTDPNQTWIDGGSDDKTRRGMFWSLNDVPTDTELGLAKARMEKHYRALIAKADDFVRQGQQREIGPEHHQAADYFHVRSTWHTVAELPATCPNCGDDLKPGVAFHMNASGIVCVIDWQRAVAAGVKSRDDVPAEARWWTAEADPAYKLVTRGGPGGQGDASQQHDAVPEH